MAGRLSLPSAALIAVAVAFACPTLAPAQSGGAGGPDPPSVRGVSCLATTAVACPPGGALPRGGRLQLRGSGLRAVRWVLFAGASSRQDDVRVRPRKARSDLVEAGIPRKALSGPLYVVSELRLRRRAAAQVKVVDGARPEPLDAAPSTRFFFDGRKRPAFAFELPAPAPVTVQVIREDRGTPVRRWQLNGVAGRNEVAWDGSTDTGPAPSAHYRFEVISSGVAVRTAARRAGPQHFLFSDHLFPIRGRHNLGYTRTNSFGGGRGHKGIDMFARCGTRLAAARGGQVRFAGYHGAAGNYVVIDGRGSDFDYVYMHMRGPALVRTGDRVFTGQALGEVGDTGNASGCHLHFELWSSPGWYAGGRAIDPLPLLRSWNRFS